MKIFLSTLLCYLLFPFLAFSQGFDYTSYGEQFDVSKNIKEGNWMDVVISNNTLFAISENSLYSFDISNGNYPITIDSVVDLGGIRQLEVQGGFAYITSRQDGLFIIDVSNPHKMKLASHYDAIEWATGISVSGNIAVLTNRIYGIELLNISDAYNPKYLSQVVTDEAQSVFTNGNYAFIGDWASRKVIAVDIRDPKNPKIISEVFVDGFPDGIYTSGNYCYVATGHHGMQLIKKDPADPAWGKGHGLEIVDFNNTLHPKVISRLKLPAFYINSPDWWNVKVSGDYAVLGDSKAGIFIVNVKDPYSPKFEGYAKLPAQSNENESGIVNNFAIGDGIIYIGGRLGLYSLEIENIRKPVNANNSFEGYTNSENEMSGTYSTGSQIHAVAIDSVNELALIAAGSGGVHQVSLSSKVFGTQIWNQADIVYDVCFYKNKVILAEGLNGLSIWKYDEGKIGERVGTYKTSKGGIYQVVVNEEDEIAAVQVNTSLHFINISDPENPVKISEDGNPHLMYKNPITKTSKYFAGMWLGDCYLYEVLDGNVIKKMDQVFESIVRWNISFGPINGFVVIDNRAVALTDNGLLVKDLDTNKEEKYLFGEGIEITGKLTLSGSTLYCSDRRTGEITAINIKDLSKPKILWKRNVEGNPGFVVPYKNMLLIPAGNGGLQVLNANSGEEY